MELENNINQINCLDKGFVRLVDNMGDDSSIVQAARVSYGKGTKTVREDEGLIRYLMRNNHTSPFEMVEFKFHVKLPIFVARQWIRHRTANVNELSGRYSEMKDEFYVPAMDSIRTQSINNKQGRSDENYPEEKALEIARKFVETQTHLYDEYKYYLSNDLARELARVNLPLSTYTEWYWKIDLHNLLHFLELRLDQHAQYEIRVYAKAIVELIKPIVPMTYLAFEDYRLNSIHLSKQELELISEFIPEDFPNENELKNLGWNKVEIHEFNNKLKKLKKFRNNK